MKNNSYKFDPSKSANAKKKAADSTAKATKLADSKARVAKSYNRPKEDPREHYERPSRASGSSAPAAKKVVAKKVVAKKKKKAGFWDWNTND